MYVARDKNKSLWLFVDKPKRSQNNDWWRTSSQDDECLEINGDLFPDLSWEDAVKFLTANPAILHVANRAVNLVYNELDEEGWMHGN